MTVPDVRAAHQAHLAAIDPADLTSTETEAARTVGWMGQAHHYTAPGHIADIFRVWQHAADALDGDLIP